MSRSGSRRPCRPLTFYGYRRRPSKVSRIWVFSLAVASLVVLPKSIHTVGDAVQRVSKVRDSALSPQPQSTTQSPPEMAIVLTSAEAKADEGTPAQAKAEIVPSDTGTLEAQSIESPKSRVTRVPARLRRISTEPQVKPAAKRDSAAPLVRQRLVGSGLTIAPK